MKDVQRKAVYMERKNVAGNEIPTALVSERLSG